MICAQSVFRCFKCLERLGDRITGAAGPYFVGLAVILIFTGTLCFYDVILPNLAHFWLALPLCLLITLNLYAHYYYVLAVSPGFANDPPREVGDSLAWAARKDGKKGRSLSGVRWSQQLNMTEATMSKCRKCARDRPERAHHCRICNRCVLKYDHHCPVRINQCVGLHNERHFVLFMAYLVLATFCFSALGYPQLFAALGVSLTDEWPYHMPDVIYILMYILCVVLCLAVGVMVSYQLWIVAAGETAVEGQDHAFYTKTAKFRGDMFINSYDLGKLKNLQLFFNIGEDGYPWYTLLFPWRVAPYTDGRHWARREGLDRHRGVYLGEELTDDEEVE